MSGIASGAFGLAGGAAFDEHAGPGAGPARRHGGGAVAVGVPAASSEGRQERHRQDEKALLSHGNCDLNESFRSFT